MTGDQDADLARIIGLHHKLIQHARTGEKIAALIGTLKPTAEQLRELLEFDPELEPELTTAGNSIATALDALLRLSEFNHARTDVFMDDGQGS